MRFYCKIIRRQKGHLLNTRTKFFFCFVKVDTIGQSNLVTQWSCSLGHCRLNARNVGPSLG